MIIVICGNIGVGKSTVAQIIAEKYWMKKLQTNTIRNTLFPNPVHSPNEVEQVYACFFDGVRRELETWISLVLDATFSIRSRREEIYGIAAEYNQPLVVVRVICNDLSAVKQRISLRKVSDSKTNRQEYLKIKAQFEPVIVDHERLINEWKIEDLESLVESLIDNCLKNKT